MIRLPTTLVLLLCAQAASGGTFQNTKEGWASATEELRQNLANLNHSKTPKARAVTEKAVPHVVESSCLVVPDYDGVFTCETEYSDEVVEVSYKKWLDGCFANFYHYPTSARVPHGGCSNLPDTELGN